MTTIVSNIVKTDVPVVKLVDDVVYAGVGDRLHVYNIESKLKLFDLSFFKGLRIHGIIPNSTKTKILLHAEHYLKIVDAKEFCVSHEYESKDWILSASWLDDDTKILTISMHNEVYLYTADLVYLKKYVCEEKCILYCAFSCFNTLNQIVLFSGTVFSEVLLWKLDDNAEMKVLKRLKGHTGVLFSIDCNIKSNMVCTTSDDRTVILWKVSNNLQELNENTEIVKVYELLGHSARVFGCKLLDNFTLSIGEDGLVNIWNLDGTLYRKIEGQQISCLWCIDADEDRNVLITGGSDGSIVVSPIKSHMSFSNLNTEHEVPKRIVCLNNNDLLYICEDGTLRLYSMETKLCKVICVFDELKSYALMEASVDNTKFALGSYYGHLILIDDSFTIYHNKKITDSRIYSIHWLHNNLILICESEGIMKLIFCADSGKSTLLHKMHLPKCKERWSTAACIIGEKIVVGDRRGHLHLYNLQNSDPIQSFKAHDYLGITGLFNIKNTLYSLGRNSTIRSFTLNSILESKTSDKLPFTWLSTLIDSTTLLAFSGSKAILWNIPLRRAILELNCGGGHRSFAFNATTDLTLSFIKHKSINYVSIRDWKRLIPYNLLDAFHSNEVNTLRCIKYDDKLLLISGGEDTTLRLSIYDGARIENLNVLKSHLSSVRCLSLLDRKDGTFWLFSAGGRAQIILWEINQRLECKELDSYYEKCTDNESEVRIMDITSVICCGNIVYAFAGCSDGKIKVYKVDDRKKMVHYSTFVYDLRCILKLSVIKVHDGAILISMASDGFIVFWNLDSSTSFYSFSSNQSGINSFSYKHLHDDFYAFATGGDDNAFNLHILKIPNKTEVHLLALMGNSASHCAQISGLHLSADRIVSSSLDQNILVFKYDFNETNNELCIKFEAGYSSTIADAKGIAVLEGNDEFTVVVYGLGLEVLSISRNKS